MIKAKYEYIKKEIFEKEITLKLDFSFHVEELPPCVLGKGMYIITTYYEGNYYTLAAGKELKGYIGDIIYIQYDGHSYGTGDYRVVSDRHGLICKIKKER